MRTPFFIFICIALACKERPQGPYGSTYDDHPDGESAWNNSAEDQKEPFFQTNRKKTHQLRDARTGMVVQSTEYPSNWKVISKPIYTIDQKIPDFLVQIEGPNHLKTFNTPTKFHVYYQSQQLTQMMSQNGMASMIRPMVGNQQLFKEEVEPRMQNSGYSFVRQRSMPEDEAYVQQKMQENGFGQGYLEYTATEWKNQNGQKALARIVKIAIQQPLLNNEIMTMWLYTTDYAFVDEGQFEATLDQLHKSTVNTKENPQWKQYITQLNQQRAIENEQKMRIAAQQHQQRMNARWAAFNAHQENMRAISAAQDANHAAFMNRNFGAGSDTGQRQFLNMINEQETVYNPLTGNNYQVNAGSTEYWMDSDGNYIQNNDLFYTPNGDINLNNREWAKVGNAY
ncbi:hypothetical protein [Flagellimonas sediminis]|uniref:Uncharacterized protein n=1 Tax=Flagellimonas sediminis TaxID=2696468 RepID=A0A6I5KRI9_9FLAO|nr:hypothetical protein [Allomuricauda sediminis]NDV42555.1 hypothetical protein [Allomuricauda sediminis]